MDGMLSQEEINALLGGADSEPDADAAASAGTDVSSASASSEERLSPEEGDALGEIANISMGTAATTLSVLLNNRVEITTPALSYVTVDDLKEKNQAPCVFVYIAYRTGLEGRNVLVLKERDVKIITDLMMGGDGTNTDVELSDLHLSAISEAMNQMMGSSATSMSTMINEMVDISPPTSIRVDFDDDAGLQDVLSDMIGNLYAQVSFKMVIGDLIDSEIIQLYPIPFARMVYERFKDTMQGGEPEPAPQPAAAPQPQASQPAAPQPAAAAQAAPQPAMQQPMMQQPMGAMPGGMPMYGMPQDLSIQPAQFQSFMPMQNLDGIAPENIDLIMDVPLEVTVELGRTSKSIKEILDFSPGTIIELDKLAGEPIDVLVNGKFVAKGEVVVIEENFGIRVTEIIKD
ncbi:MAG: flagellar motor switch phosphatase FliY [Eubacterium sp.]|jgi:flagellar motor switch protein FliN/FliY|nr:flagellar motor switch phosphatase FliY [Eubacterium sp.]